MSTVEIKTQLDALGRAWEEFKSTNDARVAEISKKGVADALTELKLDRVNDAIDSVKSKLDRIETQSAAGSDIATKETSEIQQEYKKAYVNWLRKGVEISPALEQKALSVISNPDGGFLVTPEISSKIVKKIYDLSPIRQIASVQTISSDSLDVIVDNGDNTSGWVAETGARSATTTPTIGKSNIPVHELYTMPIATQKLLDDASIDLEAWLADKVADQFAREEADAFVNGDGVAQPRGFLTYSAGTTWGTIQQVSSTSGSGGVLAADDIYELVYALQSGYTNGASFVMKRSTLKAVRQLKTTTTLDYIWQPGLQAGQPSSLAGFPVYEATDMPAITTNSLSIAFGNFAAAYQIVDRFGIRTLRDPYANKPYVQFYTTKRVGGDVVNFDAIKLLKMDA